MNDAPASPHDGADYFEQQGFGLRFGWGPNGLRRLAPGADVVVIVDVLSFSTSVDVALGRGAVVLPYRWHDGTEQAYADTNDAVVAAKNPEPGKLSLRPSSLVEVEAGVRLVLPSPNGSALTFAAADAGASSVLVGSLRNAEAVGRAAARHPGTVAVIAAGERWRGATGPLRPAVEDLLGAGAILSAVAMERRAMPAPHDGESTALGRSDATATAVASVSPEARAAMAAFAEARSDLLDRLSECGSGRELTDRGFGGDVRLAADLDVGSVVPTLNGIELVGNAPPPV